MTATAAKYAGIPVASAEPVARSAPVPVSGSPKPPSRDVTDDDERNRQQHRADRQRGGAGLVPTQPWLTQWGRLGQIPGERRGTERIPRRRCPYPRRAGLLG